MIIITVIVFSNLQSRTKGKFYCIARINGQSGSGILSADCDVSVDDVWDAECDQGSINGLCASVNKDGCI